MTNEEVHELLRAAQKTWMKYKDNPPRYNDQKAIDKMIEEFAAPVMALPDRATHIMLFFIAEIYERSKLREAPHGTV